MTVTQAEKAARFRALHEAPRPFVIPNPWDSGTARLLSAMGFSALATTSLGAAIALGRRRASRADILRNLADVCAAAPLPVSADLENGFADEPEAAASMVVEAFLCGAVGASIEDSSNDPARPIYAFDHAVERVAAAVEAARGLPVPMVVTARAENLLWGIDDLDDTIRRLRGGRFRFIERMAGIGDLQAAFD